MSAAAERVDDNLELVRAMGSKEGYDPMPPWQYMQALSEDEPLDVRALAWMRWKTIRKKAFGRTAYARDERGTLEMKHLAEFLAVPLTSAYRAWDILERKRLVRRDLEGLLWLCGETPGELARVEDFIESWEEEVSDIERLPMYIRTRFENFPDKDRDLFVESYNKFKEWGNQLEADAISAARAERYKAEAALLAAFGIDRRSGNSKRKRKKPPLVEVIFLKPTPNFALEAKSDSVREKSDGVQAKKSTLYAVPNDAVQQFYPLFTTKTKDAEINHSGSSPDLPAAPAPEQPEVISQTLPSNTREPKPERPASISGLLHAARKYSLLFGEGEKPTLSRLFNELSPAVGQAAVDGILQRGEIGQYGGPSFALRLQNYLRDQRWTEPLRPPPGKKRGDTSFLDSFIPRESTNGDD